MNGVTVSGTKKAIPQPLPKIPTGIGGFDDLSRGGLPRNRISLLKGGPGSGKTVFALQSLVNAVRRRQEADIKRGALKLAEADTRARIKALEQDIERQRVELAAYSSGNEARIVSSSDREKELRRIRSADPAGRAASGIVASLPQRRAAEDSGNSGRRNRTEARRAP